MNQAEFENICQFIVDTDTFNNLDELQKATIADNQVELLFYLIKARKQNLDVLSSILRSQNAMLESLHSLIEMEKSRLIDEAPAK